MNCYNNSPKKETTTLLKLSQKIRAKSPDAQSLLSCDINRQFNSFLENIEELMINSIKRKHSFGIFTLVLDCFYKNRNMPLSKTDVFSELIKEYSTYENLVITTYRNKKITNVSKDSFRQILFKMMYNNKSLFVKIGEKIIINKITVLNSKNQILNRLFHPDILNEKKEEKVKNEEKENKELNIVKKEIELKKIPKDNFEIVIFDSKLNKIALTVGINLLSENNLFDEEDKKTAPQSIEKSVNKSMTLISTKTNNLNLLDPEQDESKINNPEINKSLNKKRKRTKNERNFHRIGMIPIGSQIKLNRNEIIKTTSRIDEIVLEMNTKITKFILKNKDNFETDFNSTDFFEKLINKINDKHSEFKKIIEEIESRKGRVGKEYKKKCRLICKSLLNYIKSISEKFDFKNNEKIDFGKENEEGVIVLNENSSENSLPENKNEPDLIDEIKKSIKKIVSFMK